MVIDETELEGLTGDQRDAYVALKEGRNVFLSGNAGTVGEFTQIPLKLAYAITIHKSQGLTFDRCTVHTKTFAAGQLYVGLSRCSNIEGLTIFPKMEKKASEGTVQLECPQRFSEQVKAYIADLLEKEKAAEKQAAPACSSAGEALPWEREDAPGRGYQSTWNQF